MVSQTRSFCYVDDLIDGMIRLMEQRRQVTGPINIGNPDEFTIREMAEKVIAITGSQSELVFRPLPENDPMQRQPDITQSARAAGLGAERSRWTRGWRRPSPTLMIASRNASARAFLHRSSAGRTSGQLPTDRARSRMPGQSKNEKTQVFSNCYGASTCGRPDCRRFCPLESALGLHCIQRAAAVADRGDAFCARRSASAAMRLMASPSASSGTVNATRT